jgi:hypothetical protein
MTNERSFYSERLVARIAELRQRHEDDATFKIEVSRLLATLARTEADRSLWKGLLGALTTLRKFA